MSVEVEVRIGLAPGNAPYIEARRLTHLFTAIHREPVSVLAEPIEDAAAELAAMMPLGFTITTERRRTHGQ